MNFKILRIFIITILIVSIFANASNAKLINNNFLETKNLDINYRALIAAIGDYNGDGDYDDDGDLETVIGAYEWMYDTLNNRIEGSNKQFTDIKTLFNSQVTKNNFKDEINWLRDNSDSNDISFIFYNGHGTHRDTIDPIRENEANDECFSLYDKIYRDDHFADDISKIPGTVVVFLDTCKNHGFVRDVDYIKDTWTAENIIMFTCHSEHQNNYAVLNLEIPLFTLSIISSFMQNSIGSELTVEEFYDNLEPDYDEVKDIFGISYQQGAHIYPEKGSLDYNEIKNMVLLKGINNQKPRQTEINYDCNRRGKMDITTDLIDPDNDDIELYISWGDRGYGGWLGSYSSGSTNIKNSHEYYKSSQYTIVVIKRDSKGACEYWVEKNIDISSKFKSLNIIKNPLFNNLLDIIF